MNAKKQARRDRAANRFCIMPYERWLSGQIRFSSDAKFMRFDAACPVEQGDGPRKIAYDSYVARKQIEAKALGIPA